jgi:hypothetical protein
VGDAAKKKMKKTAAWTILALIATGLFLSTVSGHSLAATQQQTGSTGVEGTVPGVPPSQAATIGVPANGQTFSNIPITVSGLCPNNTLVEIYSNSVFMGSVDCTKGSYSLQIDLFDGRNDLVAKVYDSLNQAGPVSNTVTVYFTSSILTSTSQLVLTTQYAKRGANPGDILTWPITLSGGSGPYAISVDWGDKTELDLLSQQFAGNFNLEHTYAQAGIYKVTVKASDTNGNAAFLQVVGVGNGPIKQNTANNSGIITSERTKILWWPIIVLFILALTSYWLGQKHQLEAIRNRLRKGEPPFA